MPLKKRKSLTGAKNRLKNRLRLRQRRAGETSEETEKRKSAVTAAKKHKIRASESYEEAQRRRKEAAKSQALHRYAISNIKREKRLENKIAIFLEEKQRKARAAAASLRTNLKFIEENEMMGIPIAIFLKEEKERRKAINAAASLRAKQLLKFIEENDESDSQFPGVTDIQSKPPEKTDSFKEEEEALEKGVENREMVDKGGFEKADDVKEDMYYKSKVNKPVVEDVVPPEKEYDEKNINNHLLNAEFNEPLLCRSVRIGSFKVHPPVNTSLININLSMDGMLFDVPMVTDKGKTITILLKPCDISIMMVHFGRNLPIVFVFTTSSFAEALRKSLNMSDGDHAYFDPDSNDEKQRKIAFLVDRVNYRHRHFLQHGFLPKRRVVELDKKTANEILVKSTPNQVHFAQNQQKPPPKVTKSATNTEAPLVDFVSIKNVHLQEQGGKAVVQRSVPVDKMHLWEWAKMYRNVQGGHSYNLRALVQPQIVAENQATTITGFPLVQLGHVKRILREERGKNIAAPSPKITKTISVGAPLVESSHVKSIHCHKQVKNIAIPSLKITKTTAKTKAPLMEFHYLNNIHFLEQGNSPITQSSVPVNKMHLMNWTRMSKNIQKDQSNNLRAEIGCQNVAETEQFQMNCLKHFHKNFKHAEKFQNGSHCQLKSFTALAQLEVDDLVKNNIKYLTDSITQFKNLEHFKNGWERQLSCSTIEVHPEKNENVHIKMEYVTEPSEQFENGCEGQPSSLVTGVLPEMDDLVQIKMEFVAEPSEQFESVEQFKTDCEGQPCSSITGEKDKNAQIKMEFSSDQVENVEPWNMFTTELSTPNMNIEIQNDVSALISVKSSVSDTRNLSDTNHNVPLFYPIANLSKMRYLAELKEVENSNVCGAGEQLNSSETEVLSEKNGNMQIKLKSVDE